MCPVFAMGKLHFFYHFYEKKRAFLKKSPKTCPLVYITSRHAGKWDLSRLYSLVHR